MRSGSEVTPICLCHISCASKCHNKTAISVKAVISHTRCPRCIPSTAGHTGIRATPSPATTETLDLTSCADFIMRSTSAGAGAHRDAQGHLSQHWCHSLSDTAPVVTSQCAQPQPHILTPPQWEQPTSWPYTNQPQHPDQPQDPHAGPAAAQCPTVSPAVLEIVSIWEHQAELPAPGSSACCYIWKLFSPLIVLNALTRRVTNKTLIGRPEQREAVWGARLAVPSVLCCFSPSHFAATVLQMSEMPSWPVPKQ